MLPLTSSRKRGRTSLRLAANPANRTEREPGPARYGRTRMCAVARSVEGSTLAFVAWRRQSSRFTPADTRLRSAAFACGCCTKDGRCTKRIIARRRVQDRHRLTAPESRRPPGWSDLTRSARSCLSDLDKKFGPLGFVRQPRVPATARRCSSSLSDSARARVRGYAVRQSPWRGPAERRRCRRLG
jgi:ribosomal protein L34